MKVYAFCNSGSGTEYQEWVAMAETGEIVTSHLSSTRGWGIHDVSDAFKKKEYDELLGPNEGLEYIVLDDGDIPPQEVLDLYFGSLGIEIGASR